MFEVAWKEVDRHGRVNIKQKSFKTELALNRFIQKLFDKENFVEIVATR